MTQPYYHHAIPMGARVYAIDEQRNRSPHGIGTVVGIASFHVIFSYIVLFDEPFEDSEFGTMRAMSIFAPQLVSADTGETWMKVDLSPQQLQLSD